VIVSHDHFFTDKVTKHLFVFEGNGVVKDYNGSLSDYASTAFSNNRSSVSSSGNSGTTTTTATSEVSNDTINDEKTSFVKKGREIMQ